MKTALSIAALAMVLALQPSAAPAQSLDALKGQYGFDWTTDPSTVKCRAIDDRFLARVRSGALRCEAKTVSNTASGKPARVCSGPGERPQYLIFRTKAECEDERRTQMSNGD